MKILEATPEAPKSISRNKSIRRNSRRIRRRLVIGSRNQGPSLQTIQMVSNAIKEAKEYPSKYQLWRSLSKGMSYRKLEQVLNYLQSTNQIMIDKDDRRIVWILADNPKLEKLLAESTPLR